MTLPEQGASCTHPSKQEVISLDQGFPLWLLIASQSSAQGVVPGDLGEPGRVLRPARRAQAVRTETCVLLVAEFSLKVVLFVGCLVLLQLLILCNFIM